MLKTDQIIIKEIGLADNLAKNEEKNSAFDIYLKSASKKVVPLLNSTI